MNRAEVEAARNFLANCEILYPEADLMDEQIRRDYARCCMIVKKAELEKRREEYYADQQIPEELPPKSTSKKKGKLALFEDEVIECLHQGFGEEKQLLEEAYNRKNPFARSNYIKAYYRALDRFQRGE